MPRLTPSQQRNIIRNATRELRGSGRQGVFRALGGRFGGLGELIGILGDILAGGRRPNRRHVEDAVRILSEEGFQVSPGGPPEAPPVIVQPPPVVRRVQTVATPATAPRGVPPQPPPGIPADPWPAEHTVRILPRRIRGVYENIPEDFDDFSPWILTPESSNVWAYAFHESAGLLYVAFRATGKPVAYKNGISLCTGKEYKIGIRPNVPGPVYAYGGAGRPITRHMFDQFSRARSTGKAVWDQFRVCGSQWQHKVPYSIVDVPAGQPIPRKSTRRGLAVRTVPNVGLGRRGYRQSTLPVRDR